MAAACYFGCVEQLEPEQIELLAAMTDVEGVQWASCKCEVICAKRFHIDTCCVCALSSERVCGLTCQELLHTT